MNRRNTVILGGVAAGAVAAGIGGAALAFLAARRALRLYGEWSGRHGEDLRGQTVLITGSSRGLGLALAEEFARHKCKLVLCARNEAELARARRRIEEIGAEVIAVICDVSRPEQVEHLINSARQHFGRIDILVNNAGIISVGPLESFGVDDFREAMDVIFWGSVRPTLAVLPAMAESGRGRIVNITSIGGRVSVPHLLPYNCAKFATVGFSEGLHAEVRKFGVRVLTVVPGLIRTGSHLHAQFVGSHEREYGWFSLGSTNPFLSMAAERAARQIVNAVRRNRTELVLGIPARVLMYAHAAAPGLVTEAMALVNRLLPQADGGKLKKKGHESETVLRRSPLTHLGRRAARKFNQMEEPA
ncbi:MAG TPA: SDR family NAD(P)-dependent oxidoreductase [Candidatus Angelobacter sp.]|nr:SDR family NAD(P)-dependent oxidoreductase [Candidatus Angelobacter sp.]